MTGKYDYDLFVIGGGSGGVRAARVSAQHGARVALAEEYRYGGTCVIRGCVPKKLFVYAAEFSTELAHARHYGWSVGDVSFDWDKLVAAKDEEIQRLSGIYIGILDSFGIDRFHARATIVGPHEIEVEGKRITAKTILVAVGATPWVPRMMGSEHAITSNEAFHLDRLPEHITVVGAGYIGTEFASIFRGLGRQVTLVHRGHLLLRGFDNDIREMVTRTMGEHGVEIIQPAVLTEIAPESDGYRITLDNGETRHTGIVMFATGRVPHTRGLGLENAGVELREDGAVVVDDYSKTTVDSIYAVGDVTNRVQLTPVAIHEGHAFADSTFGGSPRPVDHACIPTAVFSTPHVGTVGLTEHDARQQFGKIDIYRAEFRPLKNTLTDDPSKVLVKLVVAPEDGNRVVGVHLVGSDAPEIIQAAAIAVKMGASKADFDATMALHPSTAEELVTLSTKYEPPRMPSE